MRNVPAVCLIVLAVACGAASSAAAQSRNTQQIDQIERDWLDASASGSTPNPDKQQALLATEYLQTTIQGQNYDRTLWISSRSTIPPAGKTRKEDERIRTQGDLAVVTGRLVSEATGSYSGAYSRVWVQMNGNWRLVAMQFSVPNSAGRPSVALPALPPPSAFVASSAEGALLATVRERLTSEIFYASATYDRLTANDFVFVGPTAQFSTKADRPAAFRPTAARGADPLVIEDVRIHLYGGVTAVVTCAESGTRLLMVWVKRDG